MERETRFEASAVPGNLLSTMGRISGPSLGHANLDRVRNVYSRGVRGPPSTILGGIPPRLSTFLRQWS